MCTLFKSLAKNLKQYQKTNCKTQSRERNHYLQPRFLNLVLNINAQLHHIMTSKFKNVIYNTQNTRMQTHKYKIIIYSNPTCIIKTIT
ncbi:hypothetical protein HanPSC8_Chr07g0281331 [Helianthus annuus]|nr:hypothetical protein HanPSC8_Chr07g0281331 [Helianthus annuus]